MTSELFCDVHVAEKKSLLVEIDRSCSECVGCLVRFLYYTATRYSAWTRVSCITFFRIGGCENYHLAFAVIGRSGTCVKTLHTLHRLGKDYLSSAFLTPTQFL